MSGTAEKSDTILFDLDGQFASGGPIELCCSSREHFGRTDAATQSPYDGSGAPSLESAELGSSIAIDRVPSIAGAQNFSSQSSVIAEVDVLAEGIVARRIVHGVSARQIVVILNLHLDLDAALHHLDLQRRLAGYIPFRAVVQRIGLDVDVVDGFMD